MDLPTEYYLIAILMILRLGDVWLLLHSGRIYDLDDALRLYFWPALLPFALVGFVYRKVKGRR